MQKLHLLLVVALALLAVPSAASAACPAGWNVSKRLTTGTLVAVSSLPGGAWAVGSQTDSLSRARPLIMRFDGRRWSEVPAPTDAELAAAHSGYDWEAADVRLTGVYARTASDVWAVGKIRDPWGDIATGFVLRWDGVAWREIPSPGVNAHLMDVIAFGPNDAWAIGARGRRDGDPDQPLAMHWDGQSWTRSPGTELSGASVAWLRSAARATGSRALWTVGQFSAPDDQGGALVERHRAGTWTQMFPPTRAELYGVTAVAWNDVWAVGPSYDPLGLNRAATALHWNGSRWSVVPTPSEPGRYRDLHAISAVSRSNIWAVGHQSGEGRRSALIEHWDGNDWSVAPAPTGIRELLDVSMRRYGYGWSVGIAEPDSSGRAYGVILRHCA